MAHSAGSPPLATPVFSSSHCVWGSKVNYRQLEAGGLQFQVSYSRPEETSENGLLRAPLTIIWRISRSLLIAAQQKRERRLEESTWASSTRLIILRRVLRLSCPNPHLESA